jgi:ribosomal protein L40E
VSHRYCPECGFQNPETANYCARCGSLLVRDENGEATMAFTPEHADEQGQPDLDELGVTGPALVVRSGGGRAGETFIVEGDETTVGRSPDCDIFLDDVTVSRRHAVVRRTGAGLEIEDLGSLNGTYLNRKRIESAARLSDGDELQVGKYRLTFLS